MPTQSLRDPRTNTAAILIFTKGPAEQLAKLGTRIRATIDAGRTGSSTQDAIRNRSSRIIQGAQTMGAFEVVHARLREIMLAAAGGHVIATDEPGNLVVRTAAIDPKTKQPGWFGTVTTKKSYVAYHLMPLYDDPALGEDLSDALAKRRQGKTCFNFKQIDEALFTELSALTQRANRN